MFKLFSSSIGSVGDFLEDRLLKLLPGGTALKEFSASKFDWKWELGEKSGYRFRSYFDSEGLQGEGSVYQELPSHRHTRVLQVLCTAKGDPKSFLGNLVPISVDSPEVPYIAISYTWGDPTTYTEIDCGNGKRLGITKSVYTILDTLLEKGQLLRFWIDAACINQKDADEKSRQVRIMSEIYKNAAHVVVSLGEASPETDAAMDSLYPLSKAISQIDKGIEWRRRGAQPPEFEEWNPIGPLLLRPWFERIWVVQEVAIGPEPLITCGKRAVDWHTFCWVLDGIMKHRTDLSKVVTGQNESNGPLSSLPPGLLNLRTMSNARRMVQSGEREPLQVALLGMNHFKATDPRDKVYALLRLAHETDDEPLQPDYKSAPEQVYQRVARHLLLRDPCVHILSKAGISSWRPSSGLPSWVPDFTTSKLLNGFGTPPNSVDYRAAGDSKSAVNPGPSATSLRISGIVVDKVARLTTPWTSVCLDWLTEVDALCDELQQLPESQLDDIIRRCRGEDGESWRDALWRTLIANQTAGQVGRAPDVVGKHFELWRRYILDLKGDAHSDFCSYAKDDLRIIEVESSAAMASYDSACRLAAKGRRFFATESGFMGLTSPETEAGDIVVVFLGGTTPFIVREREDVPGEFTLIGEVYVHDIMYGEAMELREVETFVLD